MSGGSDFEMMKLELHNQLNALKELTQNADTVAKIHAIQQCIARLEEQ
jgi:hypothetical protein